MFIQKKRELKDCSIKAEWLFCGNALPFMYEFIKEELFKDVDHHPKVKEKLGILLLNFKIILKEN